MAVKSTTTATPLPTTLAACPMGRGDATAGRPSINKNHVNFGIFYPGCSRRKAQNNSQMVSGRVIKDRTVCTVMITAMLSWSPPICRDMI